MSYLCIRNEGEIDIAALMLLGATDKEGSNKIGFFGSGNKYAIATLLRNNCEIRIFSGKKEFPITTKEVSFRNETYKQIVIDGKETSITTRMGPAWEVWMAIRELYCNAVDEGLLYFDTVEEIQGTVEGETAVYVSITEEVKDFVDNIENYINQQKPLDSLQTSYGQVDILDNQKGVYYRKNIRASNEECTSLYSYNFDKIDINESRLINYNSLAEERMTCALAMTESHTIINNYINKWMNTSYLEYSARWNESYCYDKLSQAWHHILLEKNTPIIAHSLASLMKESEIYVILPDALVHKISEEFPDVPIYGHKEGMFLIAEPSQELLYKVETALDELESWGMPRKTVHYCTFKSPSIKAMAYHGEVYVSIDIDTEDITSAIYEEYTHIETSYGDCSRSLQTHLFKEVIKLNRLIIGLNKKVYSCSEN